MAKTKSSKKKKYNGRNVRFSDAGHSTLKEYTERRGIKLGQFCEEASLEKMKRNEK